MIRTKDDLINALSEFIGENDADDALAILEDATDTLDDYEKRANGDAEDWKKKFEENDKAWREKYKARFTKNVSLVDDDDADDDDKETDIKTFEELFEEVKNNG